jgi:hypothetical protein
MANLTVMTFCRLTRAAPTKAIGREVLVAHDRPRVVVSSKRNMVISVVQNN